MDRAHQATWFQKRKQTAIHCQSASSLGTVANRIQWQDFRPNTQEKGAWQSHKDAAEIFFLQLQVVEGVLSRLQPAMCTHGNRKEKEKEGKKRATKENAESIISRPLQCQELSLLFSCFDLALFPSLSLQ